MQIMINTLGAVCTPKTMSRRKNSLFRNTAHLPCPRPPCPCRFLFIFLFFSCCIFHWLKMKQTFGIWLSPKSVAAGRWLVAINPPAGLSAMLRRQELLWSRRIGFHPLIRMSRGMVGGMGGTITVFSWFTLVDVRGIKETTTKTEWGIGLV